METLLQGCFIECESLRSPMISYRSLLYNTTVLYDEAVLSIYIPAKDVLLALLYQQNGTLTF